MARWIKSTWADEPVFLNIELIQVVGPGAESKNTEVFFGEHAETIILDEPFNSFIERLIAMEQADV